MRRSVSPLAIALFIISVLYSCSGNYVIHIPAVYNETGEIINATINFTNGEGELFLNINSVFGEDTETSLLNAFTSAKYNADVYDCSATLSFENVDYITGPSAGALFWAAFYYGLNGENVSRLLEKTIVTGGIDNFGDITPVGGVVEKLKSADDNGFDRFIIPTPSVYEYFLLMYYNLSNKTLFVSTIDDLKSALENNSSAEINVSEYVPEEKDIKGINNTAFRDEYLLIRKEYVKAMNEFESIERKDIVEWFMPIFNETLERADRIASKGYYYTAANELFLKEADMKAMVDYTENKNVNEIAKEVELCIKEVKSNIPEYNVNNFEYIAGANVRLMWAEDTTKSIEWETQLEKLYVYVNLESAKDWCLLSKHLIEKSHIDGERIDQSHLMSFARRYMNELIERNETSRGFIKERARALKFYINGDYISSMYEYAFAMSNTVDKKPYLIEDGFWPTVYSTQSIYIDKENSVQTLADALQEVNTVIKFGIIKSKASSIFDELTSAQPYILAVFILILIIGIGVAIYGNKKRC